MAHNSGKGTSHWRRWLVIAACLALAAAHVAWPDLGIDGLTVSLLTIAALLFLLPQLRALLPYIKRIKVFDVEIELREQIQKLGGDVEQAREAQAKAVVGEVPDAVLLAAEEIAQVAAGSPRAALLLLSAKLEQAVRDRLEEAEVEVSRRFTPLLKAVEAGVRAGVFPPQVLSAFREFWYIGNQVAHGAALSVQDSTVLSLVSLGIELLKIISAGSVNG